MDSSSNSSIEKCTCDKSEPSQESDSSNSECLSNQSTTKDKKLKISLTTLGFGLRRNRSSKRNNKKNICKEQHSSSSSSSTSASCSPNGGKELTKKSPKWSIKFNCTKKEPKVAFTDDNPNCCKCTCYRRTEDNGEVTTATIPITATSQDDNAPSEGALCSNESNEKNNNSGNNNINCDNRLSNDGGGSSSNDEFMNDGAAAGSSCDADLYQSSNETNEENDGRRGIYGISRNSSCKCLETCSYGSGGGGGAGGGSNNGANKPWVREVHDCDDMARIARAWEIEQGVEAPPDFRPLRRLHVLCCDMDTEGGGQQPRRLQLVYSPDITVDSLRALFQTNVTVRSCPLDSVPGCHTQIDFIHCLVPDLLEITKCSFYWGKMDRYEAETLLDGKPEGTFLLRDSAQEEFLFSVSFRKYNRSLHARIEQWNHKFSFDSHDPGVYNSDTVCGLIEHYKDPSSCMFFEPMLTWPLHRNFTFSLQHLCRAAIVDRLTYDNINQLQLPKTLKSYLKEYHYRQKVRVNRFDEDEEVHWLDLRGTS